MADHYGRIMVSYASFWIHGGFSVDISELEGETLISAIDDFVSVRAYVNDLYTGVRVVTHDTVPDVEDLDDWEKAEEISVLFTAPPYLFVPLTERDYRVDPQLLDLGLDAGNYRIRCYTRGGIATGRNTPYGVDTSPDDQDVDPASYLQQFRLDFWPDDQQLPSGSWTTLKSDNEKD